MTAATRDIAPQFLNKVPAVTLYFWIIKVMATTVGETAADYLNTALQFGLSGTSVIMGLFLTTFLLMQLFAKKYIPWLYWLVVVLISVVGTLITDNLVDTFGVPLETTTIAFGLALLVTFALWYASERTLSIHSIVTSRRELFYWSAILFTFALGTAAGDLVAEGLALGYAFSTLLFMTLIAFVMVAHYRFKANPVLTFWCGYVLTRPLGASFGDLLSQPTTHGGLGLGTVGTSALFLCTIAALVLYLSISQRDVLGTSTDDGR